MFWVVVGTVAGLALLGLAVLVAGLWCLATSRSLLLEEDEPSSIVDISR